MQKSGTCLLFVVFGCQLVDKTLKICYRATAWDVFCRFSSVFGEASLTSTHNLCFGTIIRKKIGIPLYVHPCIYTFIKVVYEEYILHGHVVLMATKMPGLYEHAIKILFLDETHEPWSILHFYHFNSLAYISCEHLILFCQYKCFAS